MHRCWWEGSFLSTSSFPLTNLTYGGWWGCGPFGCSVRFNLFFFFFYQDSTFFPSSADLLFTFHSPNSAIPSLRARDCPSKEKEALNYLFLIVPLLNVAIPFFWKSFALVWSADTLAFFAMYAWKVCLAPSHHYWARRFFAMYASHLFFFFFPFTTAWMAGKNRVEILVMGLENEGILCLLFLRFQLLCGWVEACLL